LLIVLPRMTVCNLAVPSNQLVGLQQNVSPA
jgi:hypothetical protein